MATHEGKRTLEDIAATQAEHTLYLARIAERLDVFRAEAAERDARLDVRLDGIAAQLALLLDRLPPKE